MRRHRQIALLQIVELFLALERLVTNRREHLELRRQRAQGDFEPHLIVARCGAAVRNHVGAKLARHSRNGLCLHDAFRAHAQRIELPALDVAHDEEAQHLLKIIGARVNLMMLDGAQRLGAFRQRSRCRCIDSARIDGDGNDGAARVLGDPGHEERGVEPTGVGKNNGLGARVSGCHEASGRFRSVGKSNAGG